MEVILDLSVWCIKIESLHHHCETGKLIQDSLQLKLKVIIIRNLLLILGIIFHLFC